MGKGCYQGDPEIIEDLADLRYYVSRTLPPTNVSQTDVLHLPQCSSALLGL